MTIPKGCSIEVMNAGMNVLILKPLNPEELKYLWKQTRTMALRFLAPRSYSDLYHRAMLAKAEHQLQHGDGHPDSCNECKTTDQ
jgi:hypothetical protein